jgi:ABC-type transport system substrate-binding protein
LEIRFVVKAGGLSSEQASQLVQGQLKEIRVRINIEPVSAADYFRRYVNIGNFGISTFRWPVTDFSVTNSRGVYYLDPINVNKNYGKVGNGIINKLFEQALSELDPGRRVVLAKRIDEEIWKSGSQLPLFQVPARRRCMSRWRISVLPATPQFHATGSVSASPGNTNRTGGGGLVTTIRGPPTLIPSQLANEEPGEPKPGSTGKIVV